VIVFSEKFPPKEEEGTIPLCKVPPLNAKNATLLYSLEVNWPFLFPVSKRICRWHSIKNNLHTSWYVAT
jgi:hypothetical protein